MNNKGQKIWLLSKLEFIMKNGIILSPNVKVLEYTGLNYIRRALKALQNAFKWFGVCSWRQQEGGGLTFEALKLRQPYEKGIYKMINDYERRSS
jgi:hypothetical protein